MFTGIVETTGLVQQKTEDHLVVQSALSQTLKKGDSIAVDGACLTVTKLSGDTFSADFMPETARKTIIGSYKKGTIVNLELPMEAGGRFDGHWVTGHVDTMATVTEIKEEGNAWLLTIQLEPRWERYVAEKGSVTLNGISLTVVSVQNGQVAVSLIPHTWKQTNLNQLKKGDRVNLEVDLIAKYIEKLMKN